MLAAMQADVVVVGGGAVGVSCALELARGGARVTLLERGPALASGCSAGNAGLICPSHSTPLANPASLRNGLRWMLRRDSPFFLKPRPAALPWLARFVSAARADRAERGARLIRALSVPSLELHAELAQRLWAAQGITAEDGRRTAPSAGRKPAYGAVARWPPDGLDLRWPPSPGETARPCADFCAPLPG